MVTYLFLQKMESTDEELAVLKDLDEVYMYSRVDENGFDLANYSDMNVSDLFNKSLSEEEDYWTFDMTFEIVVHGVLLGCVGLLGLLGNCVSIVVLSRPQMKSSINTILIGLVSCDSLLLVTSIFMLCLRAFRYTGTSIFNFYVGSVYPYILPFLYPIGLIAQTGSCYLTLAVTIERYLAVCWSLKARHLCTQVRYEFGSLEIGKELIC